MGELGELHEKINKVNGTVIEIKTILDTSLPHLATDDSVKLAIAEHSVECKESKRSIVPQASPSAKRTIALTTAVMGLTSAVWALYHFLVG